ncbi:MAG: hypothetical protein ACUVX1_12380 [Chloroflexota bacterium]
MPHPFLVEDELRRSVAERLDKAAREARLNSGQAPGWRRLAARMLLGIALRLDETVAQAASLRRGLEPSAGAGTDR